MRLRARHRLVQRDGRVRADEPRDHPVLCLVRARRRVKLVRPVRVDEVKDRLGAHQLALVHQPLRVHARAVGHAPARQRQQHRHDRQQHNRRLHRAALLPALLLKGILLLHRLLAGAAQRVLRLLLALALLPAHGRIDRGKGVVREHLLAFALAADALIVAGAVRPTADAHPYDVVLARVARRVRPGDRAQAVQLPALRQVVGRILAHIALLAPPDHAVLEPYLLHRGVHAHRTVHAVGHERAGEMRARFAGRRRADQPSAQAHAVLVKADDVHLQAVNHLLRQIEKLDEADNLLMLLCTLCLLPTHGHLCDLHRAGQIALHPVTSSARR